MADNIKQFEQKITSDTWEGKRYIDLVQRTANLEKSFSDNKKEDKDYVNELHGTHILVTNFMMMTFLRDFGENSDNYYSLTEKLESRVEELINRLYK